MSRSDLLRVLIVDDEVAARRRLENLLAAHPDVLVVGEAKDVASAVRAIEELAPTLVMLDVQMPGPSGFTLFERVPITMPVMFITAYDEYAVRAFEVNALDYLLKPVSAERLARALARVRGAVQPAGAPLLRREDVLCVAGSRGTRFVRLSDLTHVLARDDYSELHLVSGSSLLSDTSMAEWERRLPPAFVRVHRSVIVDARRVSALERGIGSYRLRLHGMNVVLPVARARIELLRAQLESSPSPHG